MGKVGVAGEAIIVSSREVDVADWCIELVG